MSLNERKPSGPVEIRLVIIKCLVINIVIITCYISIIGVSETFVKCLIINLIFLVTRNGSGLGGFSRGVRLKGLSLDAFKSLTFNIKMYRVGNKA